MSGGAGYFGSPTILITGSSTGDGTGALLSLDGGVGEYGQIMPNGISIISHGMDYIDPIVTIVPDPTQPAPVQEAKILAHRSHPEGDLYKISVADVNGSSKIIPDYSIRISEKDELAEIWPVEIHPLVTMDKPLFIPRNLPLIGSQCYQSRCTKVYYNKPFEQARARALLRRNWRN